MIRVGLECPASDGVVGVEYYLFSTTDEMNSIYSQIVSDSGSEPARSSAENCPSDGTWSLGGQDVGKLGCYYSTQQTDPSTGQLVSVAESPSLTWTYDAQNILGRASLEPGNDEAATLQTWWHDKAGPTKTADRVNGVVTSTAEQRHYQRALLALIPAVTRKNCKAQDVSDPADDYYDARMWVRAAERCTTSGGANTVDYESLDPSLVTPYFASIVADTKASESATQTNPKCPAAGTYKDGNAKHPHTVGEYTCEADRTFSSYHNGAPFAEYTWSDPKLGILAYADNLNNDPDALIAWFQSPKSGPIRPE